jgi:hypothetical protein
MAEKVFRKVRFIAVMCVFANMFFVSDMEGLPVCPTCIGVSKSPRTMLITRKSLVVHEFPTRVCCGGVL